MRRLFILGFPGLYGGAGTELHHQILLWTKAFPDMEFRIIPTMENYENEPLYDKMLEIGVKIEKRMDLSSITMGDALINFCSRTFWEALPFIYEKTHRIAWVNCMTYLFDAEKEMSHRNMVSHYLYQRDEVRDDHANQLHDLGARGKFITFIPYFDSSDTQFSIKEQQFTHIGRISRQDADKFSAKTLHIYEYITSPKLKRGHFLGWGERAKEKIGEPHQWIKTYRDHRVLSVTDFYNIVDFIVQPTDTLENLPRIGFEAMYSGKPLVVDNRGGWKHLIEHEKSGFLCNNEREFIYWGTRLAFEPDLRKRIAENALRKAKELSSYDKSMESWSSVFNEIYQ